MEIWNCKTYTCKIPVVCFGMFVLVKSSCIICWGRKTLDGPPKFGASCARSDSKKAFGDFYPPSLVSAGFVILYMSFLVGFEWFRHFGFCSALFWECIKPTYPHPKLISIKHRIHFTKSYDWMFCWTNNCVFLKSLNCDAFCWSI